MNGFASILRRTTLPVRVMGSECYDRIPDTPVLLGNSEGSGASGPTGTGISRPDVSATPPPPGTVQENFASKHAKRLLLAAPIEDA